MPRKIKVVNLESNEVSEAAGMTEVREEIQNTVVADDPVVAPKPKRAPRKKAAEPVAEETPAEPVVEETPAEPVVEETPAEPVVEETPAEPVVEKVSCPDCGKKVSAKTLKYTHKNNCKANKEKVHGGVCYQTAEEEEEDLHTKMQKLRRKRMELKAEKMSQLAASAF